VNPQLNQTALRILAVTQQRRDLRMPPPSLRYLAKVCEAPFSSIQKSLIRLQYLGLVLWQPEQHRTLQLRCRLIPANKLARRETSA
jgi:hypothetical protein